MEEINKDFKGIELAVINTLSKDEDPFNKLKSTMISALMGNRQGFTIIGPAKVIKNIKRDPNKLQILMRDAQTKKR